MVRVALSFTDAAAREGSAEAREALMPRRHSEHAAGLDLCAAAAKVIQPGTWERVPTGVAVALPEGFEGQVRPRSGLALRRGVTVLNAPGTIDADFRGEIGVVLINHGAQPFEIDRGDRIAQLVVAPVSAAEVEVCEELPPSGRATGGFGSTGTGRAGPGLARSR